MRHPTPTFPYMARATLTALAAVALVWAAADAEPAPAQEAGQEAVLEEISVRVGPESAELTAEMTDGSTAAVALESGQVLVDGEVRASYESGGELEAAWREFLRDGVDPGAADVPAVLREWSPPAGADPDAASALTSALERLASAADAGTAAGAAEQESAADTVELTEEGTRVVPSGRPLEELSSRLDRLRSALERIGGGALGGASLVVHDDYEVESGRTVDGSVALLSGELTVSGEVDGDVLVLDGDLVLESGASVAGDVLQVGGTVTNRGGRIAGELVSIGGDEAVTREMEESFGEPPAPPRPDEDSWEERYGPDRSIGQVIWSNLRDGFSKLSLTLSFFIVLAILGAIPLYFARDEFEVATATVEHSFGRSFLLGLAGQVLFFPALVVLAVGVLTIPLIPVFALAVSLAFAGGYLAVGYAVGNLIGERGYDWLQRLASGPYRSLLVGLAALQILYVVISFLDFFGGVAGPLYGLTWAGATTVTWVAFTAGFGAVALSYAGTRDDYAGPGGPGGGTEPPVPAGGEAPPPGPGSGAGAADEPAPPARGAPAGGEAPSSDPEEDVRGGREPEEPGGEPPGGEDRRG